MIGAALIWMFAVWVFQSTLAISVSDTQGTLDALQATISEGLSVDRAVPALFMVVLMVAAPLTMWNIGMEWGVRYTPNADGLRYQSTGISMLIPWTSIGEIRVIDADSDRTKSRAPSQS